VMFAKYHDITIALLSGFLLGSLNKIWPWKRVDEVMIKHAGEANEKVMPLVEKVVLPADFSTPIIEGLNVVGQNPADAELLPAIGLAIAGASLIFILEKLGSKKPKEA
jgi:putative membrane protein